MGRKFIFIGDITKKNLTKKMFCFINNIEGEKYEKS